MFHSQADNKRFSTEIGVLQKPAQELVFLYLWLKKARVKGFRFSKFAGLQLATALKG